MAAGVSRAGRRVASLLAIAMLGTTLLVFAAPSPASAADAAKFCAAVDKLIAVFTFGGADFAAALNALPAPL